jgi:glycosyltransferase involved in cell wall biosynthesis
LKLAIISHTEHYFNSNGIIVGWGPTITEVNQIADDFDRIIHIAMLHPGQAPASSLPYKNSNIEFRPIPTVGGKSISDKLKIIANSLKTISIVKKTLTEVDCFQFRAPTGIGVFVIPYLNIFSKKKGWYKYAGDWNSNQVPLAYRFQKWMLKRQSRIVTINGHWIKQPKHCLSFENPCLTQVEVKNGEEITSIKVYSKPINLCFVGRLEEKKGIFLLIEALNNLSSTEKQQIDKVYLVGMGKDYKAVKALTNNSTIDYVFCGFLKREEVHKIYAISHALILPSYSEGFPKVIPEAINFGCIPVVSDISSIGHYINSDNGILIKKVNIDGVKIAINKLLKLEEIEIKRMFTQRHNLIEKFTFRHYINRLFDEILK